MLPARIGISKDTVFQTVSPAVREWACRYMDCDPRMIMNFNVKEWLRIYNKVHALGKLLRDSRPTYDAFMNYIEPKYPLTREYQAKLESDIKTLCERSNRYLDQCGKRMPKPLWHYDKKDPGSWISHPSFRYGHLIAN